MSRRDGRPSVAPSGYPFAPPQPKGKAPVVAVIGLVVGVLPALRAKRLKIVDALAGR